MILPFFSFIPSVVPANAGTHNHRPWLLQKMATFSASSTGRGVWVPAPVRNCALGRDDSCAAFRCYAAACFFGGKRP
jgi:hypothetical protein